MGWVKLLIPVLMALLKWWGDKSDARKWKEVARDEREKRLAYERAAELHRRADAAVDDRRRRAGWTGDGHDDSPGSADT